MESFRQLFSILNEIYDWCFRFIIFLNLQLDQYGFVPNNVRRYLALDIINDAVNKGHSIDLILLDFSMAFDKISHAKLIQKL